MNSCKFVVWGFLALVVLFAQTVNAQEGYEDVVYLKDGSVIRGLIIEQIPNVSIKIRTMDRNIFVYKIEDVLKMTKEPSFQRFQKEGEKSPALACVLSLLFPGLGQYYNGDVTKGLIQDGLVVAGGTMLLLGGHVDNKYGGSSMNSPAVFATGVAFVFGSSLWSIIDAPISASNKNKKQRSSSFYGHLYEFGTDQGYVFGVDVGKVESGIGPRVTFHF